MKIGIIAGGVFVLLLVFFGGIFPSFYHEHTATCTVTGKDRGYNHETKSSEYRVYTKECGTLSNEDSLFRGKFSSGDVQGQLEEGKSYELTVVGPRIPFLSTFPNILEVN